jgi:phosphate-selective porin OprO and OprP
MAFHSEVSMGFVWLPVACALGLAAGSFPAASRAQSAPDTTRVGQLERDLAAMQAQLAQLKKDLGVDGKAGMVVVKPAGKEPTLRIGGLLQPQVELGDRGDFRFSDDNDRFFLRRARMNASGRFLEEFDFRLELDLSGIGLNTVGLRAQLTDGYVNWNRHAAANVKIGQFKTPFGGEQLAQDPRLLTVERSLASDRLTLSRQLGGQVGGDLMGDRLSYAGGLFNGNGVNANFNDNDGFTWVARVSSPIWQGVKNPTEKRLTLATNAYGSQDVSIAVPGDYGFNIGGGANQVNIFAGKRHGYGADGEFKLPPFTFFGEYLRVRYEPRNNIPSDVVVAEGASALAAYDIVAQRMQAVVRWEIFDPITDVDNNATRIWTIGGNYYIKGHDLKLQGDYLLTDREASDELEGRFIGRIQAIF